MEWRCPVCHGSEYMRAIMTGADRREYPSQFFACLGCSVVFIEPELFAQSASVRDLPTAKSAMAHEASLVRQQLEYRFWEARAKRLSGMTTDPPTAEVAAMMRRGRLEDRR
jgi:hypothetical protein